MLHANLQRTQVLAIDHADPEVLLARADSDLASARSTATIFALQPVLEEHNQQKMPTVRHRTLSQRVRRSVTRWSGRNFVLVTYHNVGMLDWAVLFWRWLRAAGLERFLLLELDGKTATPHVRLAVRFTSSARPRATWRDGCHPSSP